MWASWTIPKGGKWYVSALLLHALVLCMITPQDHKLYDQIQVCVGQPFYSIEDWWVPRQPRAIVLAQAIAKQKAKEDQVLTSLFCY